MLSLFVNIRINVSYQICLGLRSGVNVAAACCPEMEVVTPDLPSVKIIESPDPMETHNPELVKIKVTACQKQTALSITWDTLADTGKKQDIRQRPVNNRGRGRFF